MSREHRTVFDGELVRSDGSITPVVLVPSQDDPRLLLVMTADSQSLDGQVECGDRILVEDLPTEYAVVMPQPRHRSRA